MATLNHTSAPVAQRTTAEAPADIEECNEGDFMIGVKLAIDFLRACQRVDGTDTEHACAIHREGKPQAQILPELVTVLGSGPKVAEGANAILVEFISSAFGGGEGPMNLDAYEAMPYEEFVGGSAVAKTVDGGVLHVPDQEQRFTAERFTTMLEATYEASGLHDLVDHVLDSMPNTVEARQTRRQLRALLLRLAELNSILMSGLDDEMEDDRALATRLSGPSRAVQHEVVSRG